MTPEQVAQEAMHRLSTDLQWFDCRVGRSMRCGACAECIESKRVLSEYHRLAALYPDAVPSTAPTEVKVAVRAWARR